MNIVTLKLDTATHSPELASDTDHGADEMYLKLAFWVFIIAADSGCQFLGRSCATTSPSLFSLVATVMVAVRLVIRNSCLPAPSALNRGNLLKDTGMASTVPS